MSTSIVIPGFTVTQELSRSGGRMLAKGVSQKTNESVILKIVHKTAERYEIESRMKRELAIMRDYGSDGMPKAHRIVDLDDSSVLVMEDFGDCTLLEAVQAFPLSIIDFIDIALLMAKAVKDLHDKGITHSLIHPGVLLFSAKSKQIRITDYESASLLTDEFSGFINLNHYDRSLQYIAPEQSGRMNRSVDLRANLYSLGAIFYEMLTGKAVFESDDIIEIIHAHIARQAMPPSTLNPGVPYVLDQIVLKLLSKNAEDRYQSANGLIADLKNCSSQLHKSGRIEPFTIGKEDHTDRLTFPQKLYGRQKEVDLLLQNYEHATEGNFAITLVGGYSGIGKSALINEVQKPILKHRGYFVSGKYDQLKKNLPYSALLEALGQLVNQVLSEPEEIIANRRSRLIDALNGNGKLIIEVIPELQSLIGPQPNVSEVQVAEAQNRFRDTLAAFVTSFASADHPLTLFIDDLQWADASTIQFINRLAEDSSHNKYLFFIGAYRDNEVDGSHPLSLAKQELHERHIEVQEIKLGPLSLHDLHQFLAETLKSSLEETRELAVLSEQKTGANPFFFKTFIQRLVDNLLIQYDLNENEWSWNISEVKQAQITDNLVELLSQKIRTIPSVSQDVMKYAACLGNQFDLRTLADVNGMSMPETAKHLWVALSNNFVFPLDEFYRIAEVEDASHGLNPRYKFSHDRVQQAAYSLMNQDESRQAHLKIARMLVSGQDLAELDDKLFELINHFNQALSLIKDPKELETVKKLNLKGARKAKDAVAYQVALQLFRTAVSLFPASSWETEYDKTIDAYLHLAECEYMSGNYSQAEELYKLIGSKVHDSVNQHRLFDIQLRQYSQQARNRETLAHGAKILKQYGVQFLAEPHVVQVLPQLVKSKLMLAGKDIAGFVNAPKMTDVNALNAMNVLLNISATAYVFNANTMLLLVNKMTQISIKYGNAPETAFGYGLFGFIEGAALKNFKNAEAFSELSMKLIEQNDDPIIVGKVKYLKAFANQHWYEPIKESFPLLREAYQILVNNGSYVFASYSLFTLSSKELYLGYALPKVYGNAVEYSNFVLRIGERYSEKLLMVLRRFMTSLSGTCDKEFVKSDIEEFSDYPFCGN